MRIIFRRRGGTSIAPRSESRAATLASVAAEAKVSPKYLPKVWRILQEQDTVGPVLKLQKMWRALPAPGAKKEDTNLAAAVREECIAMRDFVVKIRTHTAMQFAAPVVRGLPAASQPLLNWKLREFAAHRLEFDPNDLRNDTDPAAGDSAIPRYPGLHQEAAPRWAALSAKARAGDTDLIVPAAERARYEAAFARFGTVFPDVFYVTERGRYFPDDSMDKGRLLSAGYHSVVGFYRDDTPLMELILDQKWQKEIDRLWEEFDFIADFTERTWIQYFFNQSGEVLGKGAECGQPAPADHEVTDSEVIKAMRDAYLAKAAGQPGQRSGGAGGDPRSLRRDQCHAASLEKMHVGGAEESGGDAGDSRSAPTAGRCRKPSATTCWPITGRCARRTNCRTRTRCGIALSAY